MNVVCRVCGGTDYHVEGGLYYCNECQTQTQELREEVYDGGDRTYLNANKVTIRQTVNEKKEKVKTWTTWEGYNIILKGLVDELISLGAPSELKLTTFQLWTAYLSAIKVAFFAKTDVDLPKLSAAFRLHDAQEIYDYVKTKSTRSKSKSNTSIISSDPESTSIYERKSLGRRRGISKRALIRSDYESTKEDESTNFDTSMSEWSVTHKTTSSMSSTGSKKLNFNKEARKKKLKTLSRRHLRQHSLEDYPCHSFTTSEVSSNYLHGPYHLSIGKLYAILYLGLLICKSDIYISDLLHYIHEGHLSFADYKHLFPEEMVMDTNYQKLFEIQHKLFTNTSLRLLASKIAKLIGVIYIPCPDIEKLCLRYVTELQLPNEIICIILELLRLYPPKLEFNKQRRIISNYEGRAMSYILFTLKLLFVLNDNIEHHISKLAKQLRKEMNDKTSRVKLFNWDKWVEFIELRKIFVANYHYPTHLKYFPYSDLGDNIHLFIDYWEKQKRKNDYYGENIYSSKLYTFKKVFENLDAKSPSNDTNLIIEFEPNSFTPLNSAINTLMKSLDRIPRPLTHKYMEYQIDFITKPQEFIQNYHLNAKVIKTDYKKTSIIPLPAFSKSSYRFSQKSVPCKIIRKTKNKSKVNERTEKFVQPQFENLNNNENQVDNDLIKLYEPYVSYWIEPSMLVHENLKGHFEHVEKHLLPKSFQWLLKECAQTINTTTKELYRELVIIEVYLGILVNSSIKKEYCEKNKKTRYFNGLLKKVKKEW